MEKKIVSLLVRVFYYY